MEEKIIEYIHNQEMFKIRGPKKLFTYREWLISTYGEVYTPAGSLVKLLKNIEEARDYVDQQLGGQK